MPGVRGAARSADKIEEDLLKGLPASPSEKTVAKFVARELAAMERRLAAVERDMDAVKAGLGPITYGRLT